MFQYQLKKIHNILLYIHMASSAEHYLYFTDGKYSHVGRKIPSFKPLTTSKRTTAATFVIPSSEFEAAETITHFELDASVAGTINLQVSQIIFNSGVYNDNSLET